MLHMSWCDHRVIGIDRVYVAALLLYSSVNPVSFLTFVPRLLNDLCRYHSGENELSIGVPSEF